MKSLIGVSGRIGRMERAIVEVISQTKDAEIVTPSGSFLVSPLAYDRELSRLFKNRALSAWIDFSRPDKSRLFLKHAVTHRVPLVIGTTGHSAKLLAEIKKASHRIPVLLDSNMSIGIHLLIHMLRALPKPWLNRVDVEIVEAHHRGKVDAPSGTALKLALALKERRKAAVPTHSIRAGSIVGIHQVWLAAARETLLLEHQAHDRSLFAEGAVRAAQWLARKRKGFYTMADVIQSMEDEAP